MDRTASDIVCMTEAEWAAARRFGYRQLPGSHPVYAAKDARLVGTALALVIACGEWTPSHRDLIRFTRICRGVFGCSISEADELVLLARWLQAQCGTQDHAVRILTARLSYLICGDVMPDLERMIAALAPADVRSFGQRMRRIMERSAESLRMAH